MLTLTQHSETSDPTIQFSLTLTAEERTRSRHRFETSEGAPEGAIFLRLPRGTVLRDGDVLQSETGEVKVRILAKPEPVYTVTASTLTALLQAAYHLGNRHVPVEVSSTYLRLSPDSVLRVMLEQMGLEVQEDILPFQPEHYAYRDRPQSSPARPHEHEHHGHHDPA